MTKRQSFIDILDKWIKYLREMKYVNQIILFGIGNKDELIMTDDKEINYLIEITNIKGKFHDLRSMDKDAICKLIDKLIVEIFEKAQNNPNKKDCNIF